MTHSSSLSPSLPSCLPIHLPVCLFICPSVYPVPSLLSASLSPYLAPWLCLVLYLTTLHVLYLSCTCPVHVLHLSCTCPVYVLYLFCICICFCFCMCLVLYLPYNCLSFPLSSLCLSMSVCPVCFCPVSSIQMESPPLVKAAASVLKELCYSNKEELQAGFITAGWDKKKGPQVRPLFSRS